MIDLTHFEEFRNSFDFTTLPKEFVSRFEHFDEETKTKWLMGRFIGLSKSTLPESL